MSWSDPVTFVGVPYKEGGESPQEGFGCVEFVAYWLRTKRGVDLPGDLLAWRRHFHRLDYPCALRRDDVLLMRGRETERLHMAVALDSAEMVHASADFGQVVQEPVSRYGRYITSVARLK